ncbi:MAG: alpha/beta fold hydrolase [Rhodanobacteraceae bacterium]
MTAPEPESRDSKPRELDIATPFGKFAALEWGSSAAPPLLALHGWLDNAASFARLAPLLAVHRRVIAIDLPGHGRSEHLPERACRYHIVDQVDVILSVADALGLERFDLLGHSLGAGIASYVAIAAPRRVSRLILIEGLGALTDDGTQTLTRWREAFAPRKRGTHPQRAYPSVEPAIAARVAAGGLDADEARPIVERNLRKTGAGYVWRSDSRLRLLTPLRIDEAQVRRLLTGLATPTLLLLAEPATSYLPTALMQARAARVSNIHIQRIAGPHHLHIHCAEQVAAYAADFLRPPIH